jgi:hypothetical protein
MADFCLKRLVSTRMTAKSQEVLRTKLVDTTQRITLQGSSGIASLKEADNSSGDITEKGGA